MGNTKITNLKRLAVFILMLVMLIGMFPISAFAGDSVFLETLINTDKQTYVANFTSDTKNKNRKYAFKYINMGYFLGDGCNDKDHNNQKTNPNYCFVLDTADDRYKDILGASASGNKGLNIFMALEGFITDGDSLISNDNDIDNAYDKKSTYYKPIVKTSGAWKKGNPLSYPGYNTETVTNEQSEYAQEVLSTLVASLNAILNTVNDGEKFKSTPELVNKSIAIRPSNDNNVTYLQQTKDANGKVDYQGFVIVYADLKGSPTKESSIGEANRKLSKMNQTTINATSSSNAILDSLVLPRGNQDGCLYAYIFPIVNASSQSSVIIDPKAANVFVYAVPKGFMDIGTFYTADFTDGGATFDYVDKNKEVPWITIHMLSMYANTVYKQENISVNTYVEPDPGVIPQILSGMFKGLMWALRGILGLTEIETLVFNLGSRGSASYNYGLMSENWWNVVLQYQLIFQAIAWVILVCGFIKTLIELNLSTVNPQKRMNLFDTVQKFIVVGIGLVILIPCVQFMLECNNVIVDLFASQIDTSVLNMPLVTNWIAQLFVGFAWIMLLLYINFLYIMRSVTVALLIASGPFFIATISWGHGKSSLFSSWARELIANIFVQSVHAFVLSFLCQLLSTGSFLETFAIAISIIPLTEMFRGLIFAGAGGSTSQMANAAAGAATKLGTSAVKGAVGAANTAVGLATSGKESADKEGKEGGGGGGNGSGGTSTSNIQKQAQKTLGKMASGQSWGAKVRQRSADKRSTDENKAGASKGAKIGGAALDALQGAGALAMMGAAALPDMMDTMNGMSDLMLKGDASALGKSIEKGMSNKAERVGGAAMAAAAGRAERKATQAPKVDNTASTQGVAQITTEDNKAKGTYAGDTAGGASVATTSAGIKEEKEFYASNQSIDGSNVADLREDSTPEARAQAMAAYNQSASTGRNAREMRNALIPDGNGGHTKGKLLSYTDSGGHRRHVAMTDAQVKEAQQGASKATGQFDFGSAKKVGTEADRVMPAMGEGGIKTAKHAKQGVNDLHMAMVQRHGERMAGSSDDVTYYDSEGNAGSFKTYKGEDYFMENSETFSADVGAKVQEQLQNGGRVEYEQSGAAFAQSLGGTQEGTTVQMNTNDIAGMTNAAMITSLGTAVEGSPGTYTYGKNTFVTGMDKSTAQGILTTQGISAVRETPDGMVRFGQRSVVAEAVKEHKLTHRPDTIVAKPQPLLAETSHVGGKTIGRYDMGIGTKAPNAPVSFTADGKRGGSLTFASQQSAAQFMMANGNVGMASSILGAGKGHSDVSDVHSFDNSQSGFTINFNGSKLQEQGMALGLSQDGQSMFVSSSDRHVRNPFDLGSSGIKTYEQDAEASANPLQSALEEAYEQDHFDT